MSTLLGWLGLGLVLAYVAGALLWADQQLNPHNDTRETR